LSVVLKQKSELNSIVDDLITNNELLNKDLYQVNQKLNKSKGKKNGLNNKIKLLEAKIEGYICKESARNSDKDGSAEKPIKNSDLKKQACQRISKLNEEAI